MKRFLLLGAMTALICSAAPATYTFITDAYAASPVNCTIGGCANYLPTGYITGTFTLANALPPNYSSGATDLTPQLTAYSFTDGINTYTNTDPNCRVYQFGAATDSTGNITILGLLIEKWRSGTSPHAVGDRVSLINMNGPSINNAQNLLKCSTVGGGTSSGVADLCVLATTDSNSSTALANLGYFLPSGSTGARGATGATGGGGGGGTTTPPPAVPTPSLGEWGMMLLGGLLVGFACFQLNRRAG
jgi:hypothetical protein